MLLVSISTFIRWGGEIQTRRGFRWSQLCVSKTGVAKSRPSQDFASHDLRLPKKGEGEIHTCHGFRRSQFCVSETGAAKSRTSQRLPSLEFYFQQVGVARSRSVTDFAMWILGLSISGRAISRIWNGMHFYLDCLDPRTVWASGVQLWASLEIMMSRKMHRRQEFTRILPWVGLFTRTLPSVTLHTRILPSVALFTRILPSGGLFTTRPVYPHSTLGRPAYLHSTLGRPIYPYSALTHILEVP